MNKHSWYRVLTLSIFMLLASAGLYAQQNSEITGTVVDNQGAAIPGAHVSITATATGFVNDTDTNAAGIYNFPALNLGTYDMKVEAKGFTTAVHKGLQVNISQVLRYDVPMSVGSVSETVTISATALTVQSDSNVSQHPHQRRADQRNRNPEPQLRRSRRNRPRRKLPDARQ